MNQKLNRTDVQNLKRQFQFLIVEAATVEYGEFLPSENYNHWKRMEVYNVEKKLVLHFEVISLWKPTGCRWTLATKKKVLV